MASKNNLPSYQEIDDPKVIIQRMLTNVEDLNRYLLSNRTVGSKYQEGSSNPNDSLGRILLTDPPLGSTHFGDPVLKLSRHLKLLKDRLLKLEKLQEGVKDELYMHLRAFDELKHVDSAGLSFGGIKRIVEGITMKISDLLCEVPLVPDKKVEQRTLYSQENRGSSIRIHINMEKLSRCAAFRGVKEKFIELGMKMKFCLLSFSVFPENREVHRTMLMHWWIGVRSLFNLKDKGAEEAVREVLEALTEKKLIEPVEERRKVAPSSYKMNPIVHSSVVLLAKEMGFSDIYYKARKPSMQISDLRNVFLVEGWSVSQKNAHRKQKPYGIETVFNVSERHPDFIIKWFSQPYAMPRLPIGLFTLKFYFKLLRVLYLGRWERSQKRNIEVHDHELMRFLQHLPRLKVLSFQGISTIRSLHGSICKLHELIVLDLRECYILEKLPKKIGSLISLVCLDMTGCYMLEWLPLKLALLKNLEVLKGFVVSDALHESVACKLIHLGNLTKLRKLSIEINRDDIGVRQLMEDLVELKALTSLKVRWRKDIYTTPRAKSGYDTKIDNLIDQLNKLDLQRYPHEELLACLRPRNLTCLKKLHIGGGRLLKSFGDLPKKATKCAVEVLRLTSLPKLKVGWIELRKIYFPKLSLLESYECPRVTLAPCDRNGIWRSDQDSNNLVEIG